MTGIGTGSGALWLLTLGVKVLNLTWCGFVLKYQNSSITTAFSVLMKSNLYEIKAILNLAKDLLKGRKDFSLFKILDYNVNFSLLFICQEYFILF